MKMRMVELKAVDLLCWVIVWTGTILVATALSSFIGEPLMPFAYVWLGGFTFAELIWICEFALPYLGEKWLERLARHRVKRKGGAVDYLVSSLEAYHCCESEQAAVDKLFNETTSGVIKPLGANEVESEKGKDNDN